MKRLGRKSLTTTQMIAFGFLTGILIGGGLLSLPISSRSGEWTNLLDSIFMATTAICVTGLTTVTTVEHWNGFGQTVILFLMQFGGLGVVTFTTTIFLIMRRRITLKERLLIQDAYNLDTLRGLVRLTIRILKGTLLVEGIAALLYCIKFVPEYGLVGIWKAVFTAVSAFCNAGIDLFGSTSLMEYRGSVLVNFVTMALIIVGGLGFPVWWDLVQALHRKDKRRLGWKGIFRKFQLHTKVVMVVTTILIFGGAMVILLLEWDNPRTMGNLPWGEKLMTSMFQSVTTRTAGFLTIPQENFTNATSFFCILLMFIGGSPSGTAGGVKTVTIAMMILTVVASVRGREDTEFFNRKIAERNVRKGMAVILLSLITLVTSTMALSIVEDAQFIDVFYETTSALATVGLSRNLTGGLSDAGKIIIIITMYLGRIGPITMALFFNTKRPKANVRRLPEERVIVG